MSPSSPNETAAVEQRAIISPDLQHPARAEASPITTDLESVVSSLKTCIIAATFLSTLAVALMSYAHDVIISRGGSLTRANRVSRIFLLLSIWANLLAIALAVIADHVASKKIRAKEFLTRLVQGGITCGYTLLFVGFLAFVWGEQNRTLAIVMSTFTVLFGAYFSVIDKDTIDSRNESIGILKTLYQATQEAELARWVRRWVARRFVPWFVRRFVPASAPLLPLFAAWFDDSSDA